jgi:hypothetical protein
MTTQMGNPKVMGSRPAACEVKIKFELTCIVPGVGLVFRVALSSYFSEDLDQ